MFERHAYDYGSVVADAAYVLSKLDVDDSFVNRGLSGCLGRCSGSMIALRVFSISETVQSNEGEIQSQ